jgi:hypothetical protein
LNYTLNSTRACRALNLAPPLRPTIVTCDCRALNVTVTRCGGGALGEGLDEADELGERDSLGERLADGEDDGDKDADSLALTLDDGDSLALVDELGDGDDEPLALGD